MSLRSLVLASLTVVVSALPGTTATASASVTKPEQRSGSLGRVIGLRIITPGSKEHASYHGFVRTKPPLGDPETYYWGGSSCPANKLSETQVGVLVDALRDHQQLQVRPYYTFSEAADRCIVAFDLVAG